MVRLINTIQGISNTLTQEEGTWRNKNLNYDFEPSILLQLS